MPETTAVVRRGASVDRVMRRLGEAVRGMELPAVEKISNSQAEDPFQILIATLLSARTQDATTHAASTRLFRRARTPRSMARLPVAEIERLIFPVGFYRSKAEYVKACCEALVERHHGHVPSTMEELVALPGVGRKTANLVLILAFKSAANICVDTHVHRIANRLGWVRTKLPEETEQTLYRVMPARWWPSVNLYLVTWGSECLPAGTSAVRGLRDCQRLSKNWRHTDRARSPAQGRSHVIRRACLSSVLFVAALLVTDASVAGQGGSSSTTGKPPATTAAKPGTTAAKPPAAQTTKKPAPPATAARKPAPAAAAGAAPIIVVETERGAFEFETYPKEAPKTVAHIVALVKRNFYNGQRIHRVADGFVIQFGDPNTRDFTKQGLWGTGGSGKPIGAAEMNPARLHKLGAVAMAHAGDPSQADSQMYVALNAAATKQLDGGYTVFGQVISGMDVVMNTKKNDLIKRVSIKGAAAPAAAPVKKAPAAK